MNYSVDGELLSTVERSLTVGQILAAAGLDAERYYLVQVEGAHQTSYEGKPNEPVTLVEGAKFITVAKGPTPVADTLEAAHL